MEQIIQFSNQYWFTFFMIYLVSMISTLLLVVVSAFCLDKFKTAIPAFLLMILCGIGSIISKISYYISLGMAVLIVLGWGIF